MKTLCCPVDATPTKQEAAKLRRICLALVDKQHYINLLSHTMREHVLMHFTPDRRCAVKRHIALTFNALIAEGVLRRCRGWTMVGYPAPVAYPQPYAAFACRAERRDPKPQEAQAEHNPTWAQYLQIWKKLRYPAERDYDTARRRADEIGKL